MLVVPIFGDQVSFKDTFVLLLFLPMQHMNAAIVKEFGLVHLLRIVSLLVFVIAGFSVLILMLMSLLFDVAVV